MRVKFCLIITLILGFFAQNKEVFAITCGQTTCGPCSGTCGIQTCTYANYFQDSIWVSCSDPKKCLVINCVDNDPSCNGNTFTEDTPYAWCPIGHPNTTCNSECVTSNNCSGNNGCIYETADVLCNCSPPPVTTPPPGGNPPPGGDPPPPGTTTTPPPGVTNTPTPTPAPIIQGRIQSDAGAALSGNYCAQATQVPLTVPGLSLQATGSTGTHQANFSFVNPDFYTINTVTLDLSGQPTNPLRFAHSHFGDFENTPIRHLLRQLQFRPTA